MNLKEVRWQQRFSNFNKAFSRLKEVVKIYPNLSDLEKEGMIQRFEYTFELAWKTIKDYLESKGVVEKFPRDVIKSAFETNVIYDGDIWIEMLDNRNILAHTYDNDSFNFSIQKVAGAYYNAISDLITFFNKQL